MFKFDLIKGHALHKHDPYLGMVALVSRENRHECIT
jgi:hypothetical protein